MAAFYNQATLSYSGGSTASNITVGELVDVLGVSKTAVVPQYGAGDRVTYVINLTNSGAAPLTGLTLADNLGAYAFGTGNLIPLDYVDGSVKYFVGGVLQTAPAVTVGNGITISGISVPAGGNSTIVYETTVNSFAPPGADGRVTNTATVTGEGLTNPAVAEETISAATTARPAITKSLSPTAVSENGRLTYTFTIQNSGMEPVDAAAAAVLRDSFDPRLSDLTVTFNGTAWSTPANYGYDAATGEFATVAGQITVPAAAYTQDPTTGAWSITPGVSTLVVEGTV